MLKTKHPLYNTWCNMKQRCSDRNHPDFKWYGARGVKVCQEWMDFWVFVRDMSPKPEGCTLDRIDVNGDYAPGNCRWATHSQQAINRRLRCTNTTGCCGVSRHPKGGFTVRVQVEGKRIYLGWRKDLADAIALRLSHADA